MKLKHAEEQIACSNKQLDDALDDVRSSAEGIEMSALQ